MGEKYYIKNIDDGIVKIKEVIDMDYKAINIIMEPYKSKEIIERFINENKDKRILYLSFKKSEIISDVMFDSLVFENFTKITKSYDIIIIDDLSFYSNYNSPAFIEIINLAYKRTAKIINFSIERILEKTVTIYITTQRKDTHFKEPRGIVSRFDLREKIPLIFYNYLEWFASKNENVIIYVEKDKAQDIYNKFIEYRSVFDNMDVIFYKGRGKDLIDVLNQRKSTIIIYDNIQGLIDNLKNANIIMYNDNKNFYSYKEIIFICGRYSGLTEKKEIILLSKKESTNIDKARKIARIYNEIAWRE